MSHSIWHNCLHHKWPVLKSPCYHFWVQLMTVWLDLLHDLRGFWRGNACTCNTKSIWTMEGGTRARGLDRASSSFTLRVMVFRKCSRASWRTDGSFPWTWTCTQIHTPLLSLMSDQLFRSMTGLYLDGVEDGLKHSENITKEKVPCLSQRVQ